MTQTEALRLALEALESGEKMQSGRLVWIEYDTSLVKEAITAIKAALEAKDEPVAWLKVNEDSWTISLDAEPDHIPLYTTPPQRKPLTDEEIIECDKIAGLNHTRHHRSIKGQQMSPADDFWWHFARAIEAAHGIKGEA